MADSQYQSYPYIFSSKGLFARYAVDRIPDHGYANLANTESREESSISSRLGRLALTQNGVNNTPLGGPVHSLGRLNSLNGSLYKYGGAGTSLYRRQSDTAGAYTSVATGFSGSRFAPRYYRPSFSSFPYAFFADSAQMLKDNGVLNPLQLWGILQPAIPPSLALGAASEFTDIQEFEVDSGFVYPDAGSHSAIQQVNTTIDAITGTGKQTATPADMTNILVGSYLNIDTGGSAEKVFVFSVTASTFTGFFANTHLAGTACTDTALSVAKIHATGQFNFNWNTTLNLNSPGSTHAFPGDIFSILVSADTASTYDFEIVFQTTSLGDWFVFELPGVVLDGSDFSQLTFLRSAAIQFGNPDWSNITEISITCTNTSIADFAILFNDFLLLSGGLTTTGGIPYDYRYTYFNINTGHESNPSVVLVSGISPMNEAVTATWTPSPDPQVTHVRLYRRGGTLATGWQLVAQVPVGTTMFGDAFPDAFIAEQLVLALDNDAPVTSTLVVPVNTTLGTSVTAGSSQTVAPASMANIFPNQLMIVDYNGLLEETVVVQSVTGTTFTAYFQLAHTSTAVLYASTRTALPVNVSAIAFNQGWLAGDPNNPHYLYYSKVTDVESFPPENFVEVGTPTDPIVAIREFRGQLFAWTQTTVYTILGANLNLTPAPFKTSCHHGLYSLYGITEVEGEIWYYSNDGIYAFQGGDARYVSEPIEWLFRSQSLGPVSPADPAHAADLILEFFKNEVFVAYTGLDGNRHRVVYNTTYKRWKNDDVPAFSMMTQDDTDVLFFGDTTGMIYQDRIGNFDDTGITAGVRNPPAAINFNLQTASMDQGSPKNQKNYQEVTVDIDTGGVPVAVILLFDNAATVVNLGNVTTTGRGQVTFKVNGDQGQLSRNVALNLTASLTGAVVNVFESHIRGTVEAEQRKVFDSYWVKYGSDEFKTGKQGWFEYVAPDPAGVMFNLYIEGGTVPVFTFTLPQATVRTAKRVRFIPLKAKVWRWTAASASDFQLYNESQIEIKPWTTSKGYEKAKLAAGTPT